MPNEAAIIIGTPSKEAIVEARGAIMDIMGCSGAADATKDKALDVLNHLCQVSHATVRDCTFYGSDKEDNDGD